MQDFLEPSTSARRLRIKNLSIDKEYSTDPMVWTLQCSCRWWTFTISTGPGSRSLAKSGLGEITGKRQCIGGKGERIQNIYCLTDVFFCEKKIVVFFGAIVVKRLLALWTLTTLAVVKTDGTFWSSIPKGCFLVLFFGGMTLKFLNVHTKVESRYSKQPCFIGCLTVRWLQIITNKEWLEITISIHYKNGCSEFEVYIYILYIYTSNSEQPYIDTPRK